MPGSWACGPPATGAVNRTRTCRCRSMTNTYMLGGDHDPEEIIGSVAKGVYASQFGGGQVDITNGKFVFSASQAWLIENGRLGPAPSRARR